MTQTSSTTPPATPDAHKTLSHLLWQASRDCYGRCRERGMDRGEAIHTVSVAIRCALPPLWPGQPHPQPDPDCHKVFRDLLFFNAGMESGVKPGHIHLHVDQAVQNAADLWQMMDCQRRADAARQPGEGAPMAIAPPG